MSYYFKVKLYPESLKMRDGLDLSDTLSNVREVAKTFNQTAATAANPKRILLDETYIEDGYKIVLTLASDRWLEFPTKALKSFTSKLSKIEPYINLKTPSGRFFTGDAELLEREEEEGEEGEGELSDEATLLEVTRLFFRETESNRKKIQAIQGILKGEM